LGLLRRLNLRAEVQLDDEDSVPGHPIAGMSWEGFVVEKSIRAAPDRTLASFYRTTTGVESDPPGNPSETA
jgi:hypothetical protein